MTTDYGQNWDVIHVTDTEYELLPEGTYLMRVREVLPFEGRDFNTHEPKLQYRFVWEVTDGEWAGVTSDQIVPMMNPRIERSKMHAIWKALVGDLPEPNTDIKPTTDLRGRVALCTVIHRVSGKGGTFSQVSTVVAPPQVTSTPRRARHPNPTPAYMPAGPDDDLTGA